MKKVSERCLSYALLISVLVCLSTQRSLKSRTKADYAKLIAAVKKLEKNLIEREEKQYLHTGMDLFKVNVIEEEKILHHKITPEDGSDDYVGQGDIMFSPGEEKKLFDDGSPDNDDDEVENSNKQKNDGLLDLSFRWPIDIPITMTADVNQTGVVLGLQEIERKTCLRFHLRRSLEERDWMQFVKKRGCYSHIGRIGGNQEISIGYGCDCPSTVAHEVMHALGFFHEQARLDRDNYVRVLYKNIDPAQVHNFDKVKKIAITYFGTDYDYDSLMHYRNDEFATSPYVNTIEALDNPYRKLGKTKCNDGLSETDAVQLNRMYNCDKAAPAPLSIQLPVTLPPVTTTTTPAPTRPSVPPRRIYVPPRQIYAPPSSNYFNPFNFYKLFGKR